MVGPRRRVGVEQCNVKCPYRVIRVKCYLAITISLRNNNKLLTRAPILTLRSGSPEQTARHAEGPGPPLPDDPQPHAQAHIMSFCVALMDRIVISSAQALF